MNLAFLNPLILLIIWTQNLQSQISEDYLKSVYLVKIANNFNWELSEEPIKIGVLSKKKDFYSTLRNYSINQNIGGRPISTVHLMSIKELSKYDIVYIGEENNKTLPDCRKEIKNSKTLFFTNNVSEITNSMINFYKNIENKIKLKINLSLLREHKLTPSNSMLIGIGSDNDLLFRFKENDSSILFERNLALKLKEINLQQKHVMNEIEFKMDSIKNSLRKKNQEIKAKNLEINKINKELFRQKKQLKNITKKIHTTSKELKDKELKIMNQASVFQKQNKDIQARNLEIKSQDNILEQQKNLLNIKEQYLNYAYIFSLALLGSLLLAVINFLGKQKSNKELAIRNEKLRKTLHTLKKTQAKLIQNEKMASLGMVTAGMAHEINNPMTFVYAGVNVLKKEINTCREMVKGFISSNGNEVKNISEPKTNNFLIKYSDTQKSVNQTIADIELGAKRVTDIINSLQNFSRLNEDDVKIIDLKESIEFSIKILGQYAKQKKISISTNFNSDIPQIECFPASINQVLVNLISNSIDACTNNNGIIEVEVSINKKTCIIKIKDNGCGIENKNLDKIFDPFFTTKKTGNGTGLGLSICYNIIKKHNGNIIAENNKDNGACFTVEMPIKYSQKEHE